MSLFPYLANSAPYFGCRLEYDRGVTMPGASKAAKAAKGAKGANYVGDLDEAADVG